MATSARRRPARRLRAQARRALLMIAFVVLALPFGAVQASADDAIIVDARYGAPTTRYAHGVLGDEVEWGELLLRVDYCPSCAGSDVRTVRIRLPQSNVFEDLAPRLQDLDGDQRPEVIVIDSHAEFGARLAIFDHQGLVTATPYIGRTHRWLAPVGFADFDQDGHVELAYVDRPHLAKTLRIWRYAERQLRHVVDLPGHTNHRIGWDYIVGGVRTCGDVPELITSDASWSRIMSTRFENGRYVSRSLRSWSLNAAAALVACEP